MAACSDIVIELSCVRWFVCTKTSKIFVRLYIHYGYKIDIYEHSPSTLTLTIYVHSTIREVHGTLSALLSRASKFFSSSRCWMQMPAMLRKNLRQKQRLKALLVFVSSSQYAQAFLVG